MKNAERILCAIDAKLDEPVELTIYGRAALALGFDNAPQEYFTSKDVDVVLSVRQGEELLEVTNFWQAVNEANAEFDEASGLYITHFFVETQVILTANWQHQRVRIAGPWDRLSVYRLGDPDLFLSKLMRNDPQDIADARFIVKNAGWSNEQVEKIIAGARVPEITDLREEFAKAAGHFLAAYSGSPTRVALESAAINGVMYNRETRTLDVEFKTGAKYRYLQVPRSTYRDLLKAESAGAFWNEVKNDFSYVRLD